LRISTAIYLYLVVGAIVSAGPLALGASEPVSFVLGYGVVFLITAGVMFHRHKNRPR
jgi:hypothetical protein